MSLENLLLWAFIINLILITLLTIYVVTIWYFTVKFWNLINKIEINPLIILLVIFSLIVWWILIYKNPDKFFSKKSTNHYNSIYNKQVSTCIAKIGWKCVWYKVNY